MNFRHLVSRIVLFTAAVALSHATAAAPFTNGNFETPGGPGSITFLPLGPGSGNTAPAGWTEGGPANDPSQHAEVFYQSSSAFGIVGISGDLSIGFGGNGSTGGTLSQTFDTTPGVQYTVNYFVTDQQGNGGNQSFQVEALNGASLLSSVNGSIPDLPLNAFFNWLAGPALSFTATGTSTTLSFIDTSTLAACCNWALDGVTVNGPAINGGVPEPSTWAMMLVGFAGVGFMTFRRKSKPATMIA